MSNRKTNMRTKRQEVNQTCKWTDKLIGQLGRRRGIMVNGLVGRHTNKLIVKQTD